MRLLLLATLAGCAPNGTGVDTSGEPAGCDTPSLWYRDADGDGFGDAAATTEACERPDGYVDRAGDCDDADDAVHPERLLNDGGPPPSSPGDLEIPLGPSTWTLLPGPVFEVGMGGGVGEDHATVALGGDGRFLVVWHRGTGNNQTVGGALYDLEGALVVGPFPLDAQLNRGGKPDVAANAHGYWVTWQDNRGGVALRRFDLDASPLGPTVWVDQSRFEAEGPDVAVWEDGRSVVVWNLDGDPTEEGRDVYRRYDADLKPLDPRPIVVAHTGRSVADVEVLDAERFVVVGTDKVDVLESGAFAYGMVVGEGCTQQFRLDNGYTYGSSRPAVSVSPSGVIAATWRNKVGLGVGDGTYGRFFDAAGRALHDPVVLQPPPTDANRSVVAFAGEQALFSWQAGAEGRMPGVNILGLDAGPREVALPRRALNPWDDRPAERPAIAVEAQPDGTVVLVATWEQAVGGASHVFGQVFRLVQQERE